MISGPSTEVETTPAHPTGSALAQALPMSDEQMAAAAERAKTKRIGFAPPEDEGCSKVQES